MVTHRNLRSDVVVVAGSRKGVAVMVNRAIEAKKLKMKRRGKTRRYGLQIVNTGQGPAAGGISLYKHKLVDTAFDKYLNARFPGKFYTDEALQKRNELTRARISLETDAEKRYELEEGLHPLAEVKSMLAEMQELMKQTIFENYFKVKNRPNWTQDVFFSADKNLWCVIEMKDMPGERFVRKSQTYPTKTVALQVLETPLRIRWVETVPLPELPTGPNAE